MTELELTTVTESLTEKTTPITTLQSSPSSNLDPTIDITEELGRGLRKNKPPTKLADYVTTLLHEPFPSVTPYPLDNYISSSQFSENYQAFILAITTGVEPLQYKDVILDENW